MKKYSYKELDDCLEKLGIKKNDSLFIHSSIFKLGMIQDEDIKNLSKNIISLISKRIGNYGNLFFPAYFHEYSKNKKRFFLKKSPPSSSLGCLPTYIFKHKKFYRSKNPLTSVIGFGPKAKIICENSNFSSYGINSIWDNILNIDTKFLFLGTSLADSFTLIHHMEFLHGVPHMYIKKFTRDVIDYNGKVMNKNIYAYVRYLDFNIKTNLLKFENDLLKENFLKYKKIGSGQIGIINGNLAVKFGISKLEKNKYYFLEKKPNFVINKIPLI